VLLSGKQDQENRETEISKAKQAVSIVRKKNNKKEKNRKSCYRNLSKGVH
jgi:hypothetical protein